MNLSRLSNPQKKTDSTERLETLNTKLSGTPRISSSCGKDSILSWAEYKQTQIIYLTNKLQYTYFVNKNI